MQTVWKNFIVFEGLDGAGTTTQTRAAEKNCREKGKDCLATCEPTDGIIGQLIRSILRRENSVTPWALALLYSADRAMHVSAIQQALQAHKLVVCDRYLYSSLAYQSVSCPFDKVKMINAYPAPEYIIYLDTPVGECLKRIGRRGAPAELFEYREYLTNVQNNYELAFSHLPPGSRLVRIDGMRPPRRISEEVNDLLFLR